MKKYCFPLNDNQKCELAILFSPKANGQFHYFDFMKYFTKQSSLKSFNSNVFSRSTHMIQSKVIESKRRKDFRYYFFRNNYILLASLDVFTNNN